jgi:hypothetical protein
VGKPEGRDQLENLVVDGRTIKKHIFSRYGTGNVECIDLAQAGNQWWAVVKKFMNLQVQ